VTRIIFAGGGTEALTTNNPRVALASEGNKPGAVSDARLNAFLTEIERRGVVPNRLVLGTAHQMGTCRLGSDPKTSVADPYGQVHGVRGLYIGDASGFPTASGVNPMLSTMALAYRVAQHIKASS
ncbi:MAG: GMC family oxidoreductase, partial [Ktedonobacterales bacterium]